MDIINDNLVMICGESKGGKTASLRNIKNPEGVLYLNCESGRRPPFTAKFVQKIVTDPYQIYGAFEHVADKPEFHTIVVDSLTFMMDMFESVHVIGSVNTMEQWGAYAQFMRNLMQEYVAPTKKNVIFTAHVQATLNEQTMQMEKKVPIKGALGKNGAEAFFSNIVMAKVMPVTDLEKYANPLLNITEDEELLGLKHVFQTRLTKETIGERTGGPLSMWTIKETFIDNDIQMVLDHLQNYYN